LEEVSSAEIAYDFGTVETQEMRFLWLLWGSLGLKLDAFLDQMGPKRRNTYKVLIKQLIFKSDL